jgi:hypothetical protein
MTLTLPKGWGPATVLIVLYAVGAAVGGVAELISGDLTYQQFIESMQWPALALGGLGIGRGIAYGGPGAGFEKTTDQGVGR